nr:hypothetical protein [Candidatus Woesearchaeota archaeon]
MSKQSKLPNHPELKGLSREYPIHKVMGDHYEFWRDDENWKDPDKNDLISLGVFMGSPAQDADAEKGLFQLILRASVKEGQWVGYPAIQYYQERCLFDDVSRAVLKSAQGSMISVRGVDEGEPYILPTKKFVEFVYNKTHKIKE